MRNDVTPLRGESVGGLPRHPRKRSKKTLLEDPRIVIVHQGYFRYLERASGLDAQSPGSSSDVLEYLKYSGKFLKDSDNSRHFTPGLTRLFFKT